VTPNPLAFGNTNRPFLGVIGGGRTLSLTVRNTGTAGSLLTVTLPNPPITGTNASLFTVTSNGCTSALAANATCLIGVRFLPTTTGPKTATLQINHNAPGSPTLVSLTGTGV
jgi:trimeric autotransporter adhesin